MHINGEKTKVLTVGVTGDQPPLKLKDQQLEEVESFTYLGSEVCQTAKVEREVMVRLRKAGTVYQMWRWKVFRSRNLSKTTKLRVLRTLMMPILLCGADKACHTTRHQEAKDLPHEVPPGHPGSHTVGHAEECGHLKGDWRTAD